MPIGIKDKVAILGMGCCRFGERWDASPEDLMVEAYSEAMADAGISPEQIDAAWFSTHMEDVGTGRGGTPMSIALRLPNIGVTRVENFCAGGSEAIRAAVYAVASGACDIALALGVEKLKDTGYGGLPVATVGTYIPQWYPSAVAPANFAQLASAYQARFNVDPQLLKRAIAHVSVKSHANGAKNPKAHLRKIITEEQCLKAPIIAEPLGLFDCCGVSDGAAAVIVTRPDIARAMGKTDLVTFKALQVAVSNGWEMQGNGWDGSYVHTTRIAARKAYAEAGITRPREQISLTEVHDCFSITELVTMEDLFLSEPGMAVRDVLDGDFDAEGRVPCQIDGGLKCFGHPVGASGIRMLYEIYLQLQGRAGPRQLPDPRTGLIHNLGGQPSQNVCSISIIGREED
ncbi:MULTISPECIES: acetyl-CoA acetyltransferase [unclassified Pseudomonas]|jgi:acetyl-CoA C-acetyltransferase|uniref:acetyl-CoA acetyltransferase n=1 Tax=unclassified Pseudomonas TaxID=196821 RepID=UPI0008770A0A|nr:MULTISPECIES: acetyl-CoA acetyltransferase [unclassified Pseudomonas]SCZ20684.1 acetyl-CoA C-acetyltransferase [Pseudomonas sp. NFACC44-2]SDA43959.1 acetyl-CoA C-acetyltransferase [Pseudomonas sp. NFACC51]SFH09750.1 acetyl-CoA C-acetyltransferase [Pseudomonas sp. NFACC54]SFS43584.1 acetyl-CoA C-acetyltransferase [Pseudomonas sp. NFACC48-1]